MVLAGPGAAPVAFLSYVSCFGTIQPIWLLSFMVYYIKRIRQQVHHGVTVKSKITYP